MIGRATPLVSWIFLGCAAGCFLFGAGVTVADVILRKLASFSVPGAIELTSFSIGLGALLSMPVCYATRNHVTAKLLSELRPNRFARPLGRLGAAVSLVFAAALMWIVGDNTLERLHSPEISQELRLPVPVLLSVLSLVLVLSFLASLVGFWTSLRLGRR